MGLQSLKSKLVLGVFITVIGSGLLISLLATQRYGSSLRDSMAAQVENLAHSVSLDAADKILINDLVSLQKMLSNKILSNPDISYLFIYKNSQILGHTFNNGIPSQLINAHEAVYNDKIHFQKIVSTTGERYLDIALPIFEGKAGVLRLGFSENPYRKKMSRLWLQMGLLTLVILVLALAGALLFVKHITRPLSSLDRAAQKIDEGELGVRVKVQSRDEIGRLAVSFNHMVDRIEDYTGRLEEQTMELERAHHQTRTSCGIVQEIGALQNLDEIGVFLVKRFQKIIKCTHMVLLIANSNRDILFVISENSSKELKDPTTVQSAISILDGVSKNTFTNKMLFKPPLVPNCFKEEANRQVIIPLDYEKQPLGALTIACPGECRCDVEDVNVVGLILSQAAGILNRAVLQEEEIVHSRQPIKATAEFRGIIGRDPEMQVLYRLIEDIAPTDATVLIQGESGTGKELVARAIHDNSLRNGKPFVVINCSAYPDTLLESELFGHEKGAFTGAVRQKLGRFEQANGGTVFLDEIGEIPPSAQIKLLRILQTRKFERLGGEKSLNVDVRILAATNKELQREVKNGHFREDLFYRLNVIPILLPPLRKRRNDIPMLSRHFLERFVAELGKNIREFSSETMRLLLDYSWPGNVRELENTVEHATVLAKTDQIGVLDLPLVLRKDYSIIPNVTKLGALMETERTLLQEVLDECSWNKKEAAKRLGISRSTLYEKLKKYQITKPTTH